MSQSTRTCHVCKETKSLEEFTPRMWCCRLCRNKRDREKGVHQLRRDYSRDYYLRKNYKISADQYDKMVIDRNGLCDICSSPCPRHNKLSVDHNHNTGKIRGLLCHKCNNGIGLFNDNEELLRKAAEYVTMCRETSS